MASQPFAHRLALVEAQPISEVDFARLKARGRQTALRRVAAEWQRPSDSWQQTVRWTVVAIADEWRRWQTALPELLRGDFLFTLALWVAVFTVAAAVVAQAQIPLSVRYSAGLAAVAYLYVYAELARSQRPRSNARYLVAAADIAVVVAIGTLSVPYVGYARVLLFLAALRLAARFPDLRTVPAGLLLLIPFELAGRAGILTSLLDGFAVLCTMLLVIHLSGLSSRAEQDSTRQAALAQLISSLARVRDEESLFAQLAANARGLLSGCAWAFWTKEAGADEFRAVRWAGLPEGELPVFTFTPTLASSDRTEAVLINGPLPGTNAGQVTLVQPTTGDGELNGLITIGGRPADFDGAGRRIVRQVADEMGGTLVRLQALDDQRQRADAMEQANRLAGLAARFAADQTAALAAMLPAVAEMLRSESLHLEWVDGDVLELVVASGDALEDHAPEQLPLADTRTAEALLQGRPMREPMTGRRPEDLFMGPAGLRQVAVAPLRCAGVTGTVQLARRLPRAYASGELLTLQLLAERLGMLFAAGLGASASPQEARR
jgi:hypothetical protein